jgi:predicted nucleotidyltransferase
MTRRLAPRQPPAGPLRAPLSYALGTPAKVALLRLLAPRGDPVSQREAARRTGIQVRSAQRALDDLVALGVETRLAGGREHLVRLNSDHRMAPALTILFDAEADLFRALRQTLSEVATRHRPKPVALLLFGSAARGDDRLDSDLDVLGVARTQEEAGALLERLAAAAAAIRTTFGAELRPVVLTVAQLRSQWRTRGSLPRRAAEDALLVLGRTLPELVRP